MLVDRKKNARATFKEDEKVTGKKRNERGVDCNM
jgi:hypothetical protein